MKQIINSLIDNDLYTFTVLNYILHHYPNAEVEYTFFDRNKTKYPHGIDVLLREQLDMLTNVGLTDEEAEFMKKKCYFIPEWFWTFLKGYRFDPREVDIKQDENGYLDIKIHGKWWRTVMWEMPILSILSELTHKINGDLDKVNLELEYRRAYAKANMLLSNGCNTSDMGTRRRCSKDVQDIVIRAFKDYTVANPNTDGKFVGTSNCYLAMKYDLGIIGTCSHQILSCEEVMSGVFECNFAVMEKWSEVYNGNLGIFLYDCFGDEVFFKNISAKYAKLFDGLRIDSGVEEEQLEKICEMYRKFKIDPSTKSVVYSNGLNGIRAINLHQYTNGRMKDSYGIGTWLTCGFDAIDDIEAVDIKPMNIVIKLTKFRYSQDREWHDCVKLSCDKGKTLGNKDKCAYLLKALGME